MELFMALEELRHPLGPAPLCRGRTTHQGLKGCVLHEVIVQVAVGHHPVYLDAVGKREREEEPQAGPVPGGLLGHCFHCTTSSWEGPTWGENV